MHYSSEFEIPDLHVLVFFFLKKIREVVLRLEKAILGVLKVLNTIFGEIKRFEAQKYDSSEAHFSDLQHLRYVFEIPSMKIF